MIARLLCRLFGHRWEMIAVPLRHFPDQRLPLGLHCRRCGEERSTL